jgi:hypothetical protein
MSLLEMMDNGVLVFWVVGFFNLFQWIFQSISISCCYNTLMFCLDDLAFAAQELLWKT